MPLTADRSQPGARIGAVMPTSSRLGQYPQDHHDPLHGERLPGQNPAQTVSPDDVPHRSTSGPPTLSRVFGGAHHRVVTNTFAPGAEPVATPGTLIDRFLPVYDVAITEHAVIDADCHTAYDTSAALDFMSVRTPLLTASFFVRGLPARLRGTAPPPPPELRLTADDAGLPGWVLLGRHPGREIAFGAVGKFWQADIEWRDVDREDFAAFDEPGWGKIACHFLIRPDGSGRSVVTYECRTATNDAESRRRMRRYWWLIRPFVGHVMRATLRTIDRQTVR
jgi:hypothetical protein